MQTINLDLSAWNVIPVLRAKQGDVGRKFKAILTDGGAAYPVPAGAAVSVWYSGASGEGNYTDIGADSAVSVSGNEITVELITQMLANYGEGKLCLAINTADGDQIGTWNIPYMVEALPGMGSAAAQDYFTAFSQAVQNLPYPDNTLSVAGKAADAAAVGTALAGKAPAGLVTKTIKAADEEALNNALSEEFATMAEDSARFIVVSPTSGALFGGVGMLCELYKRSSSGYGTAKFTGYGVNSPDILYKTLWAGTWQPLEWVNPPMAVAVEYRTTERWNGKVVWTTLINLGQLTTGVLAVDTGIKVTNIIRHSGNATGSWEKNSFPALYSLDMIDQYGQWIATDTSSNGTVRLRAYRGYSYSTAATIYCQLWYTKD